MMDNGASGYVLKNATQEELMEGINSVMKGKLYLSVEAASRFKTTTLKFRFLPVVKRRYWN